MVKRLLKDSAESENEVFKTWSKRTINEAAKRGNHRKCKPQEDRQAEHILRTGVKKEDLKLTRDRKANNR